MTDHIPDKSSGSSAPPVGASSPGGAARSAAVSSPGSGGPGNLAPHGRSCLCTGCLPDTWAMGTADYTSRLQIGWSA